MKTIQIILIAVCSVMLSNEGVAGICQGGGGGAWDNVGGHKDQIVISDGLFKRILESPAEMTRISVPIVQTETGFLVEGTNIPVVSQSEFFGKQQEAYKVESLLDYLQLEFKLIYSEIKNDKEALQQALDQLRMNRPPAY